MLTVLVIAVLVVICLGAWGFGYSPLQLWRAGAARIRALWEALRARWKARHSS